MRRPKTVNEAYDGCLAKGFVRDLRELNLGKVRSLVENAETAISSAQIVSKAIARSAREWMSVYVGYYEALRTYSEALLILDKVDVMSHQCLFAVLCVKHIDLDLDWGFFEKVRTKRNGVNYYGETISYTDWKGIEVQMKLYIATFKGEIERRLADS